VIEFTQGLSHQSPHLTKNFRFRAQCRTFAHKAQKLKIPSAAKGGWPKESSNQYLALSTIVITTPRCILHPSANKATDHAVEAASEELIIIFLYFLQLPNNSELKQLLFGLFQQL
jgi:hypothetical protein